MTDCSGVAEGAWVMIIVTGVVGGLLGWLGCKASLYNEMRDRERKTEDEETEEQ